MSVTVVKLSERNQMVLPKAAREALGIKPGGRVLVVIKGESVRLLSEPEDWAEYIYGLGQELWESLGGGEKFLREERVTWEKETS
jgi:AbrB family looped-hinge helix DNA binding protein